MRITRYQLDLYDRPNVRLNLNLRMIKVEAIEALRGCITWTTRQEQ